MVDLHFHKHIDFVDKRNFYKKIKIERISSEKRSFFMRHHRLGLGKEVTRRVDSTLRNKNYNVRFPVFVMRTAFGAIPTRRNVAIRVTSNAFSRKRSFEVKFCLDFPVGGNIGRGAPILSRTLENAPTTSLP